MQYPKIPLDLSPLDKPNGKPDGRKVKFTNRPEFRREITIHSGHAIRSVGPGSNNDYGIDGMRINMLLHGPFATIQFVWSPGIYPIQVPGQYGPQWKRDDISGPKAWDLGYHADAPQYESEDWPHQARECNARPSGQCFYDGTSLCDDVMELLMYDGEDAVWQLLERQYDAHNFKPATVEYAIVPPKELES